MYLKTRALVIRETKYKEADKILTILSDSEGKLTVRARGARRKGSRYAAATQLLCYSEMVLFGNRGRWSLNEAEPLEQFLGLREDLDALSLGAYFAEVLEAVSDEDRPDVQLLRLGLNGLYAMGERKLSGAIVKAAFELRAMCLSGYEPAADCCAVCGKAEPIEPMLSMSGVLHCRGCPPGAAGRELPLCGASLSALRHIINEDSKRSFLFSLADEAALGRLSEAAEAYLLSQLERRFGTLDFYHTLRDK